MTAAARMSLWKRLTDEERRAILELRDESVRRGESKSVWQLVEELYEKIVRFSA